jgi:ParB family chromosome partitioning protein
LLRLSPILLATQQHHGQTIIQASPLTTQCEWWRSKKIQRNPQQPRKQFSPEALEELSNSVREKGILQPLLVQSRPDGNYELIAGERRMRAAALAGLRQVPVIVRNTTPGDSLELAMIENIQREDLNPIEEAMGYANLSARFSLSQEEIAKKVGKNRSTVANALRLLKLPAKVQSYLAEGKLTSGQVRPLINLNDTTQIEKMAEEILTQGLSARSVENQAAIFKPAPITSKTNKLRTTQPLAPSLAAAKDQLRRRFGTKVDLKDKNGKGSIELHFYSHEELKRLLNMLGI